MILPCRHGVSQLLLALKLKRGRLTVTRRFKTQARAARVARDPLLKNPGPGASPPGALGATGEGCPGQAKVNKTVRNVQGENKQDSPSQSTASRGPACNHEHRGFHLDRDLGLPVPVHTQLEENVHADLCDDAAARLDGSRRHPAAPLTYPLRRAPGERSCHPTQPVSS